MRQVRVENRDIIGVEYAVPGVPPDHVNSLSYRQSIVVLSEPRARFNENKYPCFLSRGCDIACRTDFAVPDRHSLIDVDRDDPVLALI